MAKQDPVALLQDLFTFTIQVEDQTRTRDTESFSIRINPPRPLVITNQSDQLAGGQVGVSYATGVFARGRDAAPRKS